VLVNVLMVTVPPLLQHNPAQVLCEAAADVRDVRTRRGAVYAAFAAFFLLEGVGILLFPSETLKVLISPLLIRAAQSCCPLAPIFQAG
jgi:hypothetical protein